MASYRNTLLGIDLHPIGQESEQLRKYTWRAVYSVAPFRNVGAPSRSGVHYQLTSTRYTLIGTVNQDRMQRVIRKDEEHLLSCRTKIPERYVVGYGKHTILRTYI